jgi:N-acyl-D-aspartate/D-glutamate deacylase
MTDHDLILKGGLIVDGSGGAPFVGDVAINGDRIAAVGRVTGSARRTVDATGLIVTPGFVDVHTHYDGQAIWSDRLNPSSSHGVTTVVIGNCGVGFAPCRASDHDLLLSVMEGVEDIPGVVMAEGLPWTWETFPEYLDALEARPHDIDVAVFLPHSPLRVYVMGDRGAAREAATPDDLARMRALAKEAIEAGAIGFGTSRVFVHRTSDGKQIPSFEADRNELIEIASGMEDAGTGIIQAVLAIAPWEEELGLLGAVTRASGRPATFTFGAPNAGEPIWKAGLEIVERLNRDGPAVTAQMFPRPVGMIAGLELSTHPFTLCPSFKAIEALPLAEKLAIMRDPAFRATLVAEPPADGHPLTAMARNWDWMFPFNDPPSYEPPLESSVGAQARRLGVAPAEVAYDLLMADEGKAMLLLPLGNYHDGKLDAVGEIIRHPNVIAGLGDGGAHYSVICDASFPTFTLAYWARDRARDRLSLAEAVRFLTHAPARTVGLEDRGLLAPGYKADVNLIDFDRLTLCKPETRYDLPAGGRRLDQRAEGYVMTIVSGETIIEHDLPTQARPGRLVRGVKTAPEAVA